MSECIEKISHDVPTCGSSDALAVYQNEEGVISGYCWSCGTHVPDPYSEGTKQSNNFTVKAYSGPTVNDIYSDYPSLAIPDRGLSQATCEYFGVKVGLSTDDGVTIANHYYPCTKNAQTTGYKDRKVAGKKFFSIGDCKDTEMFGQFQASIAGGKKLFITEGEIDAMSIYEALRNLSKGTQWEYIQPSVVSVNHGAAAAAKNIGSQMHFVNQFDEIVLVFDMDEQGQSAAKEIATLLPPDKVKIAKLPKKDANEMLTSGMSDALRKAIMFNAQAPKSSRMVTLSDVKDLAMKRVEWGKAWPWPSLTKLTYGRRRGQLIGVGAGTGVGKTQFWHQLIEQIVYTDKLEVGLFMLEEGNVKTLKAIASKFYGKDFNNPETEYTQDELDTALSKTDKIVHLYNHNEDMTWQSIKEEIRYLVLVDGVKDIILDPIGTMVDHLDGSTKNDALNAIFKELQAMAEALDFTFYYSSHLNPPESGAPHEEGGRVKAFQFTGSRAMIKNSAYIIGLERNTQEENDDIRNTVLVRILKDRDNGRTGWFDVHYNPDKRSLLEQTYKPEENTSANY